MYGSRKFCQEGLGPENFFFSHQPKMYFTEGCTTSFKEQLDFQRGPYQYFLWNIVIFQRGQDSLSLNFFEKSFQEYHLRVRMVLNLALLFFVLRTIQTTSQWSFFQTLNGCIFTAASWLLNLFYFFFTQNLCWVLWQTVQAHEKCSRSINIIYVLLQTGIVQLFLWPVSSR